MSQFDRRFDGPQRPTPPPGSPAIIPTRPDAPPGEPTYGEADVRAHISRVGPPLIKLYATGPYTIARIDFLTGAEAEGRHAATLGPPLDRLYCLVTLSGTFSHGGPPPLPGRPQQTLTYQTITLVFDGRTGNTLGAQARP